MPKRSDIKSILIIGAGPIIIGQACEFDYSGAQACKALREEGYKVILVNSNPATIMTDPEMADVTYIEPITWQVVEKIIATEKPDAILPTMGGQTALNCALDLHRHGILDKYKVELIGATPEAIDKAEDRSKFKDAMTKIGLGSARSGVAHSLEESWAVQKEVGFPTIIRPSFTMGGSGGGIAYNEEEFEAICKRGLEASPTNELLIEERVRDGSGARQGGQLHHHLLDRKPGPDGRAHRRLDHRRSCANADRQGIPDHAQRLAGGAA
jgi:carbamoyl-phosphate synthase large subunit